jgi:wobble nucleotide-excising tRNase
MPANLEAKLSDISEKLQLVLVQQNEIKNINLMCLRLENWLKDHEHRLQNVEGAQKACRVGAVDEKVGDHEHRLQDIELTQKACKISTVSDDVKALRKELAAAVKEINGVKKAPGKVALGFLKSVALLAVGAGFTWLAKG